MMSRPLLIMIPRVLKQFVEKAKRQTLARDIAGVFPANHVIAHLNERFLMMRSVTSQLLSAPRSSWCIVACWGAA